MTPRSLVHVAGLALAYLAAGCSALSPQPDRTKYFLLKPLALPERQSVNGSGLAVGLGPVAIPDHLQHQLVTRLADNEIALSDTDRWADTLRECFTTGLRENLIVLLGTDRIFIYPWDLSASPAVAVAVEVLRFERTAKGTVELAARWTIERGSDRARLLTEETRVSQPIQGVETRAAVAALSSALVVLSGQIASAVRRASSEESASRGR
jgi:uncharacterized lipoprotein YmbA